MAELDFGKIGVLMGGPSTERAISLKSGNAVYESLSQAGLDVLPIDIKTDGIDENKELIKSSGIDVAFIALHGRFGEDGQIQEILDALKMPYTGSGVKASKLAMDKIASRKIFEASGLSVPKYKIKEKLSCDSNREGCLNGFALPLVVKPASHGSSIGLSIVEEKEHFAKALDLAFSFDDRIVVEEYIMGREVTVGILDEKSLPVIEIIPKKGFFDYEAKYQTGLTDYMVPARIPEGISAKIQQAALSAHKLLDCYGCSRVDLILDGNNTPFVLEVNTIPGMTATSLLPKAAKVAGIDFSKLCVRLIELAYEKTKT